MSLFKWMRGKTHAQRYRRFLSSGKAAAVRGKIIARQKKTGKVQVTKGFFG